MNKQKIYTKQNYLKSEYIDCSTWAGSKLNHVFIPDPELSESEAHLNKKIDICRYLRKNNYEFYTEVKFKNHHKADIVAFNKLTGDGLIIEIVKSESEESQKKKINEFPIDFELIFVKVNEEFKI